MNILIAVTSENTSRSSKASGRITKSFEICKCREFKIKKGTYQWIGDNKFIVQGYHYSVFF